MARLTPCLDSALSLPIVNNKGVPDFPPALDEGLGRSGVSGKPDAASIVGVSVTPAALAWASLSLAPAPVILLGILP